MHSHAQGAIEYLLIIGAAILIVVVVVIALSGLLLSGEQNANEQTTNTTFNPLEVMSHTITTLAPNSTSVITVTPPETITLNDLFPNAATDTIVTNLADGNTYTPDTNWNLVITTTTTLRVQSGGNGTQVDTTAGGTTPPIDITSDTTPPTLLLENVSCKKYCTQWYYSACQGQWTYTIAYTLTANDTSGIPTCTIATPFPVAFTTLHRNQNPTQNFTYTQPLIQIGTGTNYPSYPGTTLTFQCTDTANNTNTITQNCTFT